MYVFDPQASEISPGVIVYSEILFMDDERRTCARAAQYSILDSNIREKILLYMAYDKDKNSFFQKKITQCVLNSEHLMI